MLLRTTWEQPKNKDLSIRQSYCRATEVHTLLCYLLESINYLDLKKRSPNNEKTKKKAKEKKLNYPKVRKWGSLMALFLRQQCRLLLKTESSSKPCFVWMRPLNETDSSDKDWIGWIASNVVWNKHILSLLEETFWCFLKFFINVVCFLVCLTEGPESRTWAGTKNKMILWFYLNIISHRVTSLLKIYQISSGLLSVVLPELPISRFRVHCFHMQYTQPVLLEKNNL